MTVTGQSQMRIEGHAELWSFGHHDSARPVTDDMLSFGLFVHNDSARHVAKWHAELYSFVIMTVPGQLPIKCWALWPVTK